MVSDQHYPKSQWGFHCTKPVTEFDQAFFPTITQEKTRCLRYMYSNSVFIYKWLLHMYTVLYRTLSLMQPLP